MKIIKLVAFIVIGLLMFSFDVSAQYVYTSHLGAPALNASLAVSDGGATNIDPDDLYYIYAESVVYIALDFNYFNYVVDYSDVVVSLEIEYFDKYGVQDNQATEYINLELSYSNSTTLGKNLLTSDYFMKGGYPQVEVTVEEIKVDGQTANECPDNITLYAEMHVDRVVLFDPPSPSQYGLTAGVYCKNELRVNWNVNNNNNFVLLEDLGAYSYDLEWTFVDKYSSHSYSFKNNASRINTKENTYNIPLIYPEGTVVYRVRPVGRETTYPYKLIFGEWSVSADEGTLSSLPNLIQDYIDCQFEIDATKAIDEHKNWQSMINYAEEGKRNEVIKYFDGSNRERQTIARRYDSLSIRTVVQEKIYDYLGRPAVSVLPVPDLKDSLSLKYREKFSKSQSTSDKYSWADFNIEIGGNACTPSYNKMSTDSGASRYYSEANPKKYKYPFLPDAEGYPFSLTEFTNDNTGRISRQGGVGATLRLSADNLNHDTKYFYSVPSQDQLNRLFGTEVGKAEYYKRNAVLDPNGQFSVSYLDPQGRTIATALAGDPDDNTNLDHLPDDGVAKTNDYNMTGDSNITAVNGSIEITEAITITFTGNHKLYYAIIPELFTDTCIDFCYTCTYDLEIRITDPCGVPLETVFKDKISVENIREAGNCSEIEPLKPLSNSEDFIYIDFETKGTYYITKILTVNADDRDTYQNHFIQNNTCITPIDTLIKHNIESIDPDICEYNCVKCYQEAQDAFNNHWITAYEYAARKKECRYLCDTITICDMLYEAMKIDVSPYGQYASYADNIGNPQLQGADRLSIFNTDANSRFLDKIYSDPSISYVEFDGTPSLFEYDNYKLDITDTLDAFNHSQIIDGVRKISPNYLIPSRFVADFDPSWADALVVLHPEYDWYTQCREDEPTFIYTDKMMKTNSPQDALNAGYFNPINTYTPGPFNFIGSNNSNIDPICTSPGCITLGTSLNSIPIQPANFLQPLTYNSIWDLLKLYDDKLLVADGKTCTNSFTQKDLFFFRGKYIQLKNQILNSQFTTDDLYNLNTNIDWYIDNFHPGVYPNGCDCPFGSHSYQQTYFFECFKKHRRFHLVIPPTTSSTYMDGSTINNTNNYNSSADGIEPGIENNEEYICNSSCDAYAELWISQLLPCLGIVDNAALTNLRTNLKEICMGGCNSQTPTGNIISPTPSSGGYYSFEEAFDGIIGKEHYTETCNPLLLTVPLLTYPDAVPLDTCACKEYMKAYSDYMTSLPSPYCSFADYAQATLGEMQPNTMHLLHKCIDKYSMSPFLSIISLELLNEINNSDVENLYYNVIDELLHIELKPPDIIVKSDIGCHCMDCYEYKKHLDNFYQQYGHINFTSDTTKYELITRYLNHHAGYSFTLDEVMGFGEGCDTLGYLTTNIDECGCRKIFDNAVDFYKNYYDVSELTEDELFNCNYDRGIDYFNLKCYCDSVFPSLLGELASSLPDSLKTVLNNNLAIECNDLPPDRHIPTVPLNLTCDLLDCKDLSTLSYSYDTLKTQYSTLYNYYSSLYENHISEAQFNTLILNCCSATETYENKDADKFTYWFNKIIKDNGGLYNSLGDTIDISSYQQFLPMLSFCGFSEPCNAANMEVHYNMASNKIMNITFVFVSSCNNASCSIGLTFSNEDDVTFSKLKNADFSLDKIIFTKNCNCLNYVGQGNGIPYLCYSCTISGLSSLKKSRKVYVRSGDVSKPFSFKTPERSTLVLNERKRIIDIAASLNNIYFDPFVVNYIPTSFTGDCFGFECPEANAISTYNGPRLCPVNLPTVVDPVDCDSALVINATQDAYDEYNNQVAQQTSDFAGKYNEKCMKAWEKFYLEVLEKEYHYTLYYYDQAGNLIKTVPPAGVKPIDLTTYNTAIEAYRNDPVNHTPVNPAHEQITNYQYNHLNQLVRQHTPDGGLTKFWYDNLGRIVASQNERQLNANSNLYSYTVYDALGRVIEVGEVTAHISLTQAIAADSDDFFDWLSDANAQRHQVTRTFYDEQFDVFSATEVVQNNLRNRVASIVYIENDIFTVGSYLNWLVGQTYLETAYNSAIHYSYDIHGNVERMIYDIPWLARYDYQSNKQRYKTTEYEYDLISGKVNKVKYQDGKPDCFYHKYEYDGDNRLISAYTSRNGWVWDEDAHYNYYLHGPLMRTQIGENKVQGIDYAYTLQGWLKGVNSSSMLPKYDMGKDGFSGVYQNFARDAFGYSIDYYNDSTGASTDKLDYLPIGRSISGFKTFLAWRGYNPTSNLNVTTRNLFNGNINYLTTSLPDSIALEASLIKSNPMVRNFHYDKLNRITKQEIARIDTARNTWYDKNSNYLANYTYDPNGNLLNLQRNNEFAQPMDDLHYSYQTSSNDYYSGQTINRLSGVVDNVSTTTYPLDFEGTTAYTYDNIGNLITDSHEEIATIEWNTYGKVRKVTRSSGSHKADLEFWYDPLGNRLCKIEKPRPTGIATNQDKWTFTWYIRDAQGNIMATYDETHNIISSNHYGYLHMKEFPIYGSSRLGVQNAGDSTTLSKILYTDGQVDGNHFYTSSTTHQDLALPNTRFYHYFPHYTQYELTNHLGNVLVTISARPRLIFDNSNTPVFQYKEADVLSVNDYYPFGSTMPGRSWTASGTGYRFGFNSQEKTDEIAGAGNHLDFKFRGYDTRLGRFWSVDPLMKSYPWNSPYAFAENRVIDGVDFEGKEYSEAGLSEAAQEAVKSPELYNLYPTKLKMESAVQLFRDRSSEIHNFIAIPISLQKSTVNLLYSNSFSYAYFNKETNEINMYNNATKGGIENALSIILHESIHKNNNQNNLYPYVKNIPTGTFSEAPSLFDEGKIEKVENYIPPSNSYLDELHAYSAELGLGKEGFVNTSSSRKEEITKNITDYSKDLEKSMAIEFRKGLSPSGEKK